MQPELDSRLRGNNAGGCRRFAFDVVVALAVDSPPRLAAPRFYGSGQGMNPGWIETGLIVEDRPSRAGDFASYDDQGLGGR